jgi:hypothetical protein
MKIYLVVITCVLRMLFFVTMFLYHGSDKLEYLIFLGILSILAELDVMQRNSK